MFYYSDLIYILPALILTMWASARVKSTYNKYSRVMAGGRITADAAARRILDENGCTDVAIERVAGQLTDHYDPKANVIRLSESVYGSSSIAAIGVAAHECGHAIQYAENYSPIRLRSAIIPVTNFSAAIPTPSALCACFHPTGRRRMTPPPTPRGLWPPWRPTPTPRLCC